MQHEIDGGTRKPVASDQGSAHVALKHAVARLAQLLDRETAALRMREPVDMDDLCHRKNQALLELSRIGRRIDGDHVDEQLRSALAELRKKLDENRSVLELHLQAVSEVADILATAIRDADSDGTYSTGLSARLPA
jgi:hypothetical protein